MLLLKILRNTGLAAALLSLALPLLAQPPEAMDREVARLDEMLRAALAQNPSIQSAERRARAAAAVPRQVSSLPDPMLGYTRWLSSVETRVGPQENVFVLSQRIPFPGKLGLMGKMAGQDALAADYDAQVARREVQYQVKAAYADLYRIDRSLAILATYKRLLGDFSRVAATKYATGQGIQAQVLKADVEISTISTKELDLSRMRKAVVARLNALMNRPQDSPIGQAVAIDTAKIGLETRSVIDRALANRQELLSNQAMIDKAGFAVALAKRNYFPDFTVQATYITIPKVQSMFADVGKDPYAFMVGLNLPILLGPRRAASEQAQENRVSLELRLANLRNMVEAEIEDTIFQIKTSEQTLQLYEEGLLVQAQSSLESATSAYQTGSLDFLNLLDAERMILQIRLAYVTEQANHFKQVAALERATGGTL